MPGSPEFGATFAPTADAAERAKTAPPPYQGPMQVLNYRLPSVTGAAGAISPLVGEPRRPSFGSAVLESVLRTILSPDQVESLFSGSPAASQMQSSVGTPGRDTGSDALAALSGGDYASPFPTFPRSATPAPNFVPAGPVGGTNPPEFTPDQGSGSPIGGGSNMPQFGGPGFDTYAAGGPRIQVPGWMASF